MNRNYILIILDKKKLFIICSRVLVKEYNNIGNNKMLYLPLYEAVYIFTKECKLGLFKYAEKKYNSYVQLHKIK